MRFHHPKNKGNTCFYLSAYFICALRLLPLNLFSRYSFFRKSCTASAQHRSALLRTDAIYMFVFFGFRNHNNPDSISISSPFYQSKPIQGYGCRQDLKQPVISASPQIVPCVPTYIATIQKQSCIIILALLLCFYQFYIQIQGFEARFSNPYKCSLHSSHKLSCRRAFTNSCLHLSTLQSEFHRVLSYLSACFAQVFKILASGILWDFR